MKKFKKIYIEITNVCNLKCTFCPDTKRKKEFMEVESFKKIISKICNDKRNTFATKQRSSFK